MDFKRFSFQCYLSELKFFEQQVDLQEQLSQYKEHDQLSRQLSHQVDSK